MSILSHFITPTWLVLTAASMINKIQNKNWSINPAQYRLYIADHSPNLFNTKFDFLHYRFDW